MVEQRMPIPHLILSTLVALIAAMASANASAQAAVTFTNDTQITIPDGGTAPLYPSSINVQGQPGRITDIAVTLPGFSHSFLGDVDVLLVSPGGDASIVMSDACRNTVLQNATLAFNQVAAAPMPALPPCFGGLYRPTEHPVGAPDLWPGAPPGPHVASFDRFIGDNPNGVWRLYVLDDYPGGGAGRISGGWSLTIETHAVDAVVPGGGGSGVADPYPITRAVSGASGVITDLDVSLSTVYHARLDDLDLLLVGPRGQKVMLMSDACGATAARGQGWRWDDEAAGAMSVNGPCPTAAVRPTNFIAEELPGPAPGEPYASSLSAFDFTEPGGEWRLYAYDDKAADADGFFVERFALQVQTRPKAKVGFATGAVEVTEGHTRELTLTRPSGGQGLGAGTVTVTSSPLSASSGDDYKPVSTTVEFAAGETEKTISIEALTDSLAEDPEAFALTIGVPTGDAEAATPQTAVVTIRDPVPGPGGDPGPGGPAGPGGRPGGSGVDRDAPVIGPVTLSPRRFAVARHRTARTAVRGSTIRYTLSEPASVTLRAVRSESGRTAGRLRRPGRAGRNRVPFSGRIGRRPLRRGAYRLIVSAVDTAGNRSTASSQRFRITR